jgi:hypothetical protein
MLRRQILLPLLPINLPSPPSPIPHRIHLHRPIPRLHHRHLLQIARFLIPHASAILAIELQIKNIPDTEAISEFGLGEAARFVVPGGIEPEIPGLDAGCVGGVVADVALFLGGDG